VISGIVLYLGVCWRLVKTMKIFDARILAASAAAGILATFYFENNSSNQQQHVRRMAEDSSKAPQRKLQTVESCPALGSSPKVLSEGTLDLQAAPAGSFCLLVLTDATNYLPIARR
jgi:hypothetical protein